MADPGDFTIELDELDDVVGDLEWCERDLSAVVEDLDRQMLVLHGSWEGLAAAAQYDAHREWSSGMAAMRAALAGVRAAARLAHGHYSEAATTNGDMWRQVT
jgi:ESAT-6 family protein